jgi:hypothetical protein
MSSRPNTIDLKTQKPKVFIGSTQEALKYAEAIKTKLQKFASFKIWNEDIWKPGGATLENLINLLKDYDFAVLILDGEDLTASRELVQDAPRDNVIFELGLFMGHLGRFRTFFLCRTNTDLKIPTDLKGITYIPFEGTPEQANKAVENACKIIRDAIETQGLFERFSLGALTDHFRMASWEEIYSQAVKLASQAESRVRATSFGTPHVLEGLKLDYFETLAKRAAEQKKNRKVDFVYKVVYTAGKSDPQRDISLRDRREVFEKYDAFDCLQAREIDGVWRVDFLIVDNKSLLLCFQRIRDHSLALGLQIVDAEELVGPIASWYDECLFDNAKPVNWDKFPS